MTIEHHSTVFYRLPQLDLQLVLFPWMAFLEQIPTQVNCEIIMAPKIDRTTERQWVRNQTTKEWNWENHQRCLCWRDIEVIMLCCLTFFISLWGELGCLKDNWIGRDILHLENHSEYKFNHQTDSMESKARHAFRVSVAGVRTCPSIISSVLVFFCWSVKLCFNQDPAHINNFKFPAMALIRLYFSCAYVRMRMSMQVKGPLVGQL